MDIEKIYNNLAKEIESSKIYKNEQMSKHTSFKIGGNADILVRANCINDIAHTLKIANTQKLPIYIIGNGSNILVKDKGIRGIVIKVDLEEIKIEENNDYVEVNVGAGVKLAKLAQVLLKNGIEGFEFASRNTRNNRWCNYNECWCTWKRNERYYCKYNIYKFRWKYKDNSIRRA